MQTIPFKRSYLHLKYPDSVTWFGGNAFLPHRVFIPLTQNREEGTEVLVNVGEHVREGQIIARRLSDQRGIFSSIPGTIIDVREFEQGNKKLLKTLVIKLAGSFDILGRLRPKRTWRNTSQEEVSRTLLNLGVVNTCKEYGTLYHQIKSAQKQGHQTLAVRLFDLDPTSELDSFLGLHFFDKIVEGAAVVAKSLGANTIYFLHTFKKKDTSLTEGIENISDAFSVQAVKMTKEYPYEVHRSIPNLHTSSFFIDATTALAVHEAFVYDRPETSTYVLVTGQAIKKAQVLKVLIGTPLQSLIADCNGLTQKPQYILKNGLLRGTIITDPDFPIDRRIKSIHITGTDISHQAPPLDCIHCGMCLQICPSYLDPSFLARQISKGLYTPNVFEDLTRCAECGCCASVCPARIPILEKIKQAKHDLSLKEDTIYND